MQTSHLVVALVSGILIGGGVILGATFFGGGDPTPPPPVAERPPTPEPAPPPAPTLGGRDLADLNRRLADLANRVAALETGMGEKAEQLEPLLKALEQARASGLLAEDGTPVHGGVVMPDGGDIEIEGGAPFGKGYAKKLADSLGLQPERKAAFKAEIDRIFEQIKELEKENATVTTEGDTTTIRIAPYESAGVQRDWDDWVARNLTPDEQAQLEKEHATNRLYGSRLGGFDREIKIKETGGMIDIMSSASHDGSQTLQTQEVGPVIARDLMLEPYAHLLD